MKNKIIRILLSVLFVIIFLLYIGPVITVGEYNLGIIAGLGFDFILLIYIIFFNKINLLIKSINKKKSRQNRIENNIFCSFYMHNYRRHYIS